MGAEQLNNPNAPAEERAKWSKMIEQTAKARQALERARELFPNSPEINWKLANFCVRAGKTSEALQALRKVLAC